MEEWNELSEDFKNLENAANNYKEKLEQVHALQDQCRKQIDHQRYRMKKMRKSGLEEEFAKRESQLRDIEQTLPKQNDPYLKIILGNINVSILHKEDKLKYKSDYEQFKLILSVVAFGISLVNLLVFVNIVLDRIHLFLLVWYYSTLTVRESILIVNGSKIKGWWRLHHFISATASALLLIWPENEPWHMFRERFMIFNVYLSFVQYLQFRYQSGVLYRLKALGERHNMDVTIEGFHSWMWRGLSFLFPFLFTVYFFQLYLAISLFSLRSEAGATWHVKVLALLFFTLFVGNTTTMIMIIPNKYKRAIFKQNK